MNTANLLTGVGLGAALAFVLDSNTGRRRRALVRDKVVRASRKTRDGLDATARDLANRTRGMAAATRGRMRREVADDATVRERIRARLGRVCSHPRAIEVEVRDGNVTLRGQILAHELPRVLSTASNVRGVRSVDNELEAHSAADNVPALQGNGRIAGPRLDILQRNWAPATQALVIATGVAATGMWFASSRR